MTKFDTVLKEALRLYLLDWKKTEHNSFIPDMYVFKHVMGIKETMPYVEMAIESLKIKNRVYKLQEIKNELNGKTV
jgi:hypothetical protein